MPKRSPQLLFEDILMAERYVGGLDEAGFLDDDKTVDAVVRNLEIIGEAARSVLATRAALWHNAGTMQSSDTVKAIRSPARPV